MLNVNKILTASAFVLSAGTANAAYIDFIDLTEGAGNLGESAWSTLSLMDDSLSVNITGTGTSDDDGSQFAYLDWGTAGLGVCKDVSSQDTKYSGSKTNRCNPSSDDNITSNEYLTFTFLQDTLVTGLFVNSNHDSPNYFSLGEGVLLNGSVTSVTNYGSGFSGDAKNFNKLVTDAFTVGANQSFTLGYSDKQFYLSKMTFEATSVPEPGTLALLGLGLAGLGVARRRKQS